MKTIFVDDEESAIKTFIYESEGIEDIELVEIFDDSISALDYVKNNQVDLAVLDINMTGMNGIELGNEFLEINPDMLLIYLTGHEEYALDAFKMHAAGYVTKPYSKEDLEYAVQTAGLLSKRPKRKITVRTFGYFDVFVDDKPIMFKSQKAKELLALLVDRQGGTVTSEQIIATLWEGRPNDAATQSLCSKTAKTLEKELRSNGAEQMLVSTRTAKMVDVSTFDCDLYRLLDGKSRDGEKFIGEYMMEYSWAEERMALLYKFL